MVELIYDSLVYRLRAASPMPAGNDRGQFVLHTFMAEKSKIEVVACTENLPASSEFRGQGGDLMSASFTRLNVKGGTIFSGRKIYKPDYVDEDEIA